MIIVKEFPDRQFENKNELFTALRENKADLIATKKMAVKEADAVIYVPSVSNDKGETIKAETADLTDLDKIQAKLVINSMLLMDSHSDVHLKGTFKKSVMETKNPYLLQEHRMKFDHIISDVVVATLEVMSWKELGQKFQGDTEALMFNSTISKDRNEFMFNQYAKGFVKEHSVGMRYVRLELAINSDSKWDVDEKKVWDKYIEFVANKEVAESQGYMWVIHEAKIIEGSAVVKGSNPATPTISIEAAESTSKESESSTDKDKTEPSKDTQTKTKPTNDGGLNSFFKNL